MAKSCQDSCLYLNPAAPLLCCSLLGSDSKFSFFHLQSFPTAGCSRIISASPRKRDSCQQPLLSLVCLSKEESGIWLVLVCYFDSTSLPFALLGSVSTSGLGQKKWKMANFHQKKIESIAVSQVFCHLVSRRAKDSQPGHS